ncbi:hypothetical protein MNBD_BACTEROID06-692 [hydrothermal vent metagenome]|uniref:Uncharacterized protein n=1 Tax=hydrothermal vent metagenome TaxID=652676 RepID=A0A3B0UQK4_9ZZZZ
MQEPLLNGFVLIRVQTGKDPYYDLHRKRGPINLGLI